MIEVSCSHTIKYHGTFHLPYHPFIIDDNDKQMMINNGCTILKEELVRNVETKKNATTSNIETAKAVVPIVGDKPKKKKGKF